jgi:hypothetical protein
MLKVTKDDAGNITKLTIKGVLTDELMDSLESEIPPQVRAKLGLDGLDRAQKLARFMVYLQSNGCVFDLDIKTEEPKEEEPQEAPAS